jgi:APA family basic amino acid/polyamine antiporter
MSATVPIKREIGFWTAVSLVVGSMIGSGVFLLPANLAPYGGISLLGWVVTAVGSIMLALSFAHLARRSPAAGGLYAYTRDSFGDFAGFLVAWGYWISMWSANAAIAIAFAGYAGPLFLDLTGSPAGTPISPMTGATIAIAAIWFLTGVNALGVGAAGRVQVVTTALKLLPLAVISIAGLFYFDASRFAIPDPSTPLGDGTVGPFGPALMTVMTLTLFAFLGLEAATIPAESVENPDRTIPRATVVGTIATAIIYIASTAAVMSLVAPDVLVKSTAPFADAARVIAGDWLGRLIGVGAAISAFGALNGWILVVSQLPMAVARDRMFPSIFGKVNAKGTPIAGMLIAAVLSSTLVLLNFSGESLAQIYGNTILLSTLATLLPYSFCSLAVFLLRGRRITAGAGAATVGTLGFIYACFAIYGAGAETVFLGFLLLIASLPVYVWIAGQRPHSRQ